ncbi:hypothetical protein [Nonomuraea indica]|uniref:hypothetical protein n=1 Tax=Nonomuraea indica TaxID=1581193 RepID=UPI000C7A1478|nr:hypothetical protein [Nonomuraea indica]
MARRSYTSRRDQAPATAPLDFDLDGVTFVAQGSISMMDISEFARLASQGLDSKSPQAVAFLADVYLSLLGPEQYRLFREHTRTHHTKPSVLLEILGDLVSGAVEEEAGRPTGRSSDSSDGPPTAPDSVTVVSFKRGTVEQEKPQEPVAETPPVLSYG